MAKDVSNLLSASALKRNTASPFSFAAAMQPLRRMQHAFPVSFAQHCIFACAPRSSIVSFIEHQRQNRKVNVQRKHLSAIGSIRSTELKATLLRMGRGAAR
jgi:hypothetical protein